MYICIYTYIYIYNYIYIFIYISDLTRIMTLIELFGIFSQDSIIRFCTKLNLIYDTWSFLTDYNDY